MEKLRTLIPANFNWALFILIAFALRLSWIELSWYCYTALLISIYQFMLLIRSVDFIMPLRYLIGMFMCLQFLMGPTFAYAGLDYYQISTSRMQVDESVYFSYVIPAMICSLIGLHWGAGKFEGEIINRKAIENYLEEKPMLPYYALAIGFLASFASQFFSALFGNVFYLLTQLRYIGLFLIILSKRQVNYYVLALVFGSVIASSLAQGMFHDLLTWILFTSAVFLKKYKFSNVQKFFGIVGFIALALIIQQMKSSFRTAIATEGGGLETFTNVFESKQEEGSFFNYEKIAASNLRINQGYIITYILKRVPQEVEFSRGEALYKVLEAAFLPRIIAPNKLQAGEKKMFHTYTGIMLSDSTSMGLSSLGDAYANFGVVGGCIFLFLLALFYNKIIVKIGRISKYYPILVLFTPMFFIYTIRPDCELQTSLGHLIKSLFLIGFILLVWKSEFFYFEKKIQPAL